MGWAKSGSFWVFRIARRPNNLQNTPYLYVLFYFIAFLCFRHAKSFFFQWPTTIQDNRVQTKYLSFDTFFTHCQRIIYYWNLISVFILYKQIIITHWKCLIFVPFSTNLHTYSSPTPHFSLLTTHTHAHTQLHTHTSTRPISAVGKCMHATI